MDRRYHRQYENFDTVVPRVEDFPVLNTDNSFNSSDNSQTQSIVKSAFNVKSDDIVLIGILILLLMEEDRDITAILGIAFLFLAEYIF